MLFARCLPASALQLAQLLCERCQLRNECLAWRVWQEGITGGWGATTQGVTAGDGFR
ncbi:WhiB family transcriptional regulator [Streptomyces smyrnaeus]|uniref:WhiB family transcriptional regulator n=1 Tax=Streptomyces smyrnaeus TaxID=1387713 RepID=UPI0036A67585